MKPILLGTVLFLSVLLRLYFLWKAISLRGHRDDSTASCECSRGNFQALVDYSIKSGNTALAKHLQDAGRNATYTSKTTQNDLIELHS